MKQAAAMPNESNVPGSGAYQGLELRHLRYFVAIADAGTFTRAAERAYVSQPTLSQQIRKLEEIVGAPLLQRLRGGVRLTPAGTVLLQESRTVLSLLDHGVSRSRQAAGLGRLQLRVVLPPSLPERLAIEVASRLRSLADAAGSDVTWMETPLDAGFSLISKRRADAGLGWLTADNDALAESLEVMRLGEFQPEVWVQSAESDRREIVSLDELARMNVIYSSRRTSAATYDAWLAVLRTRRPDFDFITPPFRHSLPMTLAFASAASRPTAVLTDPVHPVAGQASAIQPDLTLVRYDMTRVGIQGRPLTATAVLAWSGHLPRELQQILFDAADGTTLITP
jgi:DNA-binding transcriptional LysR family regulator